MQSTEIIQIQESNKVRILEFIKANPGTHLRKIKRELNLAMGVIQYHLYKLEREGRILSVRHGLHKRFYAEKDLGAQDREILNILAQESERDLVLYLIQNPLATQRELSKFCPNLSKLNKLAHGKTIQGWIRTAEKRRRVRVLHR